MSIRRLAFVGIDHALAWRGYIECDPPLTARWGQALIRQFGQKREIALTECAQVKIITELGLWGTSSTGHGDASSSFGECRRLANVVDLGWVALSALLAVFIRDNFVPLEQHLDAVNAYAVIAVATSAIVFSIAGIHRRLWQYRGTAPRAGHTRGWSWR